jgi:ribosomal protein S18 acetylase RimI-like enzyme
MTATITKFRQIWIAYSYNEKLNIKELLDFLQLATHWSKDRTESNLSYCLKNSLSAYVTFDGDHIVGFGRIIGDGYHLAVLTDIACHPDYRGQAIATNIVKSLCADVPHCRRIIAATSQAKGLYEKLGFVEYSGDTMEFCR